MLATNKDFRGKYTTLRSMLDFNSDEEVARVVRENLSASRGRLARHRNAQHRKYTTEDNGFPRCLDTEVSVTKSELRRPQEAMNSYEALDCDTEATDISLSTDGGNEAPSFESISPLPSSSGPSLSPSGTSPSVACDQALALASSPTMDTLVDMTKRMFSASSAIVTVTDLGREQILASRGMEDFHELKRHLSLFDFDGMCFSEGDKDTIAVVSDISQDSRFATMLPTKKAFYAGVPLLTPEGDRVGAICIFDDQGRDISDPPGR